MLNRCEFIGFLGKTPEVRTMSSGKKVCNLSIAVSEKWKDKQTGERKERTEWVRAVVFNEGLVRVCEAYLKSGSKIYLSGKMQTRKWADQSGEDKYTTEVVLNGFSDQIVMLDGKSDGGYQDNQPSGGVGDLDQEIPF